MSTLDPLFKHAVTPPVFGRGKIHRERLVDLLHANIPRKLVVVAAPAGYGKTSLMADFAAHTDLPVVWVGLTDADRDLMRLVNLLAGSMARRFRRLRGVLDMESLAGTEPEGIARVFAQTIDERIGETFVIMLDDIHLVNKSKRVTDFLDAFLEVLPEQVTLIVAGRAVAEFSLAKLMAEGDLAGVGPHDLALTESELRELTKERFGVALEDDEAERIFEETRGWITGVLLSGNLSGGLLEERQYGPRPMVYEYLASVILHRQSDSMRRFLLDTAVMPVMTTEACDSLLERRDSDRYLRRLLKEGIFLTATGESPRTYEYHPQFREFLLDVVRSADAQRVTKLAKRAAAYLARQGLVEHAVGMYLDAGSAKKAAQLAEREARAMSLAGHIETLETWSQRFAEEGVAAPQIGVYLAALQSDQGLQELGERTLAQAVESMGHKTPKHVRAHAENVRALIAYNRKDYPEALKAAEKAEALASQRSPRWLRAMNLRMKSLSIAAHYEDYGKAETLAKEAVRLQEESGDVQALAAGLFDLSNCQALLGKAAEAHATSLRAHEILEPSGPPLRLGISYNNLAVTAHMDGRYQEALDLFRHALKNARLSGALAREAIVLYGQADLFNDLGLSLQAAELYGQGLTLATRIDSAQLIRYGCLQTSALHRRRGGNALARDWLERAIDTDHEKTPTAEEGIQLAALELVASPGKSIERIRKIQKKLAPGIKSAEQSLGWYFVARSALSEGDFEEGQAAFEQALSCAGSGGNEQLLAAELNHDAALLEFTMPRLRGNPVFSVVLQRIETMQALAKTYHEPGEALGSSSQLVMLGLGQGIVMRDDETLSALTPFARELLFYIVDHQRVEREILVETFWPDYPPGRQTSNLHTAVYALRRAIGKEAILFDGSVYELSPAFPIEYDVLRFERTAAVADNLPHGDPRRLFALTEAINSYAGPFLSEFASQWVTERRRVLEMRYLDLAASYADEALLRSQPLRAVNTLRRALRIDPYRDDLNLRMLEALGRLGRRSEIVSHYQQYVRLLADELGLDPPYALRDAYTRLIG
jgi:ATP/maltotriose-dependent transcriptional regulator MalT/DNA-binding SARP family transcriptional activator